MPVSRRLQDITQKGTALQVGQRLSLVYKRLIYKN